MMNFEIEFKDDKELDDIIDDFQMAFEEKFEENKYIIAGFLNLKETDGEDTIPEYDAFWTYSLCHFRFSYTVFDNDGGRPEAGLFAPCTMYMYIKKGTNKIVIGMPRLENWTKMLGLDKKRADLATKLDNEIPKLMKELGAVETENVNPLFTNLKTVQKEKKIKPVNNINKKSIAAVAVATTIATSPVAASKVIDKKPNKSIENQATIKIPVVPKPITPIKVVTVGGGEIRPRTRTKLSTVIPLKVNKPKHSTTIQTDENSKTVDIGMTQNGRVSTYLRGTYMEVSEAKKILTDAGFKILSISEVDKKGLLTTIVFTNDTLLKLANKKGRGFMASLRILIDNDNKQFTISNPLYFSKAFMQDDHDEKVATEVLKAINKAFDNLKNSKDNLKYTLLPKYQFMFAMPYYQDMIEIGRAEDSNKLLEKVKAYKGGKNLVFQQVISKDIILIGVKLGKRTKKFIGKIGTKNALLLPYPILLENGIAKILDPKYYISISYPMLKMSQFMKISTVPGAIKNDCQKLFK
jgi:Asp-tRNA(Asn)/Glu-tRNA(Gln) amidotransferase C subunit